jgi:hypothetical protein
MDERIYKAMHKIANNMRAWLALTPVLLLAPNAIGEESNQLGERMRRLEQIVESQQNEIQNLRTQVDRNDEQALTHVQAAEMRKMIKEVMADTDFRSQLVAPTLQVGYDGGFYIRSSDDNFSLKAQLATQFRYIGGNRQTDNPNLFGRQKRDDLNGFEWERTRLILSGHLHSPKLEYTMEIDGDTDLANDLAISYFFLTYEYADDHKIQWGLQSIPQGYQGEHITEFYQTSMERSIISDVFYLGVSHGVAALGTMPVNDDWKFHYMVGLYNGFNDGADDVRDVDTNFATGTRLSFEYGEYGDGQSDTREDKSSLAALLGFHFAYNNDNNDTSGIPLLISVPDRARAGRGGFGRVDASGTDHYQLGFDVGFKHEGLSMAAEYFIRHVDNDSRRSPFLFATLDQNQTLQGGYAQAAYLIPDTKIEPYVRLGGIWGDSDDVWVYTTGANYYIKGNAVKLTGELVWMSEAPTTSAYRQVALNDDIFLYRLQLQVSMQ